MMGVRAQSKFEITACYETADNYVDDELVVFIQSKLTFYGRAHLQPQVSRLEPLGGNTRGNSSGKWPICLRVSVTMPPFSEVCFAHNSFSGSSF